LTFKIISHNCLSESEFRASISNLVVTDNPNPIEAKLAHFLENDSYSLANTEDKKLFLAIEQDEVVGYIFYKKVSLVATDFYSHLNIADFNLSTLVAFEVEYLYVKSSQRSKGIGKKLISKVIEDYNLETNALIIELWSLKSAVDFYKKFAFKDDLDDNSQPTSTYMYLD
jgi:hypothetical protein